MIYGKIKHLVNYYGLNDDLDEVLDYIVSGQTLQADSFDGLDKVRIRAKKLTSDSKLVKYFRAKKKHLLIYVTTDNFNIDVAYTKDLSLNLDDSENDSYYYDGLGNVSIKLNPEDFIILFPEDASKLTTINEERIFEIEIEL